MRRCFGLRSRNPYSPRSRTPSRTSVSSTANGKSAPSAEETRGAEGGGEPPISSSSSADNSCSATTLRLSSREYQRIINSLSFKEIQDKISSLNDGEASIKEILQPKTASVEAALRGLKPPGLNRLVSEYFTHSEQACRLCLTLQSSIRKARYPYGCLRAVLDSHPPHPEDGSGKFKPRFSQVQCEAIYDEFQKFVHYDDGLDPKQTGIDELRRQFDEIQRQFNELHKQFNGLDGKLQRLQKKAEAEERRLQLTTKGSALCLVLATVALAAAGLAVAAHAAVTLLASSPAFLAPCCFLADDKGCDPLGPRKRRAKGRVKLVRDAERGTLVSHHLLTIEMLVKNLHNTMESDMEQAQFVLQTPRGDRHAVELVLDRLRNEQDRFFDHLDELEKHICICCNAANQTRQLLYNHICDSSSRDTRVLGEMADDAGGSSRQFPVTD